VLKLRRPALPPEPSASRRKRGPKAKALQKDLDDRQKEVNRDYDPEAKDPSKLLAKHWGNFKSRDDGRFSKGMPSVKGTLRAMSHGKCAYCEVACANQIDHHWPKAPADENERRGTPQRMFQWQNFLLACGPCNDPERKGARMEWVRDGDAVRPKLLDPSADGDDPLCYFTIRWDQNPAFTTGWIDTRPDLSPDARERARYTISLLKLNDLDYALRGRRQTLSHFNLLLWTLVNSTGGPDQRLETGRLLREDWREFLSANTPYLAPVRQRLRESPELRDALVAVMPELEAVLIEWDLQPDECAHVRSARTGPPPATPADPTS
jgi:uncharacterized protein (TIGR02646 family)